MFAVMTNNLLREWHLRIKFVDDTTTLEILPRKGISLLNVAVNDIHKFLPPKGSSPEAGRRPRRHPNVPRVKKKYRIVVVLVCENFLDLMKLGAG